MKPFFAAVRFLTILPVPTRWSGDAAALGRSTAAFPLVGLVIGGVAAAAAWGLFAVLPPLPASVLVVLLLVAVSGGLHMDGLADTADGFFSARPREQVLTIMRDSRVGTMGVLAIVFVVGLKVALLAAVAPAEAWLVVLLMPLAGRCAMVWMMNAVPYARGEAGLGAVFYRHRRRQQAIVAVAVLGAVAAAVAGWMGVVVMVAVAALALGLSFYAHRRIGGATGDTCGATCELAEIVPLLLLVPLWQVEG